MSPRRRELDEDDVRVRPGKGSRPRTRTRPDHDDAVAAVVVGVDRGRFTCLTDPGGDPSARTTVIAMKARELSKGGSGRTSVVVGDQVGLVGDTTGVDGSLARIVRVTPRTSVLRRTADDSDPVERVIVANADQLAVVTAAANPEPRPRLVDRCLVAAFDAGLHPLLVVTKTDLAPASELRALYAPLGVTVLEVGRRDGDADASGLEDLRAQLVDHETVLVGHSGVGKSTLVNALVPTALRATGDVNAVTGRGRHTSTSAMALALPFGGWVVDTPGLRSFGLAHVQPTDVLRAFNDLAEAAQACPRGCTHAADSPDCALDEGVTAGTVDATRLTSFRRLLASRTGTDAAAADPATT